ncbi:MAG: 2-succinyl-5-enolpyruvyl-6-hydroxy-3-cyclohexene-1-carboxylic-acid synthase, partial [Actinomycetota bacterium]
FATDFERVFGTPHGADLVELLAAPRVRVQAVDSVESLRRALDEPSDGVRIIVARCASRADEASQVAALRAVTG